MRLFIDEPFKWATSINAAVVLNLPASRVFDYFTDVRYQQLMALGALEGASDEELELGSKFTTGTPSGATSKPFGETDQP